MICMPSPMPIFFMRLANNSLDGSMCGSGEDLSEISSTSKKSAPGMCCAKYSALALRLVVGRCMEPSSTTRAGVSRCQASQSVSTNHFCASSAIKRFLFRDWGPLPRSGVAFPAASPFAPLFCRGSSPACSEPLRQRRRTASIPSRERDADAAVELALLFDLGDHHLADLASAPHVRAAAGL